MSSIYHKKFQIICEEFKLSHEILNKKRKKPSSIQNNIV